MREKLLRALADSNEVTGNVNKSQRGIPVYGTAMGGCFFFLERKKESALQLKKRRNSSLYNSETTVFISYYYT